MSLRTISPLVFGALLGAAPIAAHESSPPWTPLSLATCGVDKFDKSNPEADGRGVIIAVLDTGVEIAAQGLRETSDGERKVIDVQDFSGEGDLHYSRVELGATPGTVVIRGKGDDPVKCRLPDGEGFNPDSLLYGVLLDESEFENSSLGDLDGDGESNSVLPILIYEDEVDGESMFVAIIDTDGDRSFGGERVLADFRARGDSVRLKRSGARDASDASFAVNIFPAERRLSLHFDSHSHGTHVAGIAAGFELGGESGFNGVAPGAKVMSLKIGNGRDASSPTSSGSMLAAVEYAARYSREHSVPIVLNISYGLNSEREGASAVDKGMERILRENPLLVVCTSAGNEGPGLSTVGTPGACASVISVAALFPPETVRDTRGTSLPDLAVAPFSSRGGEVSKPDIATPGIAASSVPAWVERNDVYAGTSMASPYAAGLCARLLSAAISDGANAQPTRDSIRRALASGATMPPGTTTLDVGAGVPDLTRAFKALESLQAREREDDPSAIEVTSEAPDGDGSYSAALFRGTRPPADPQKFTLSAKFPTGTPRDAVSGFHRRYFVRAKADWVKPVQESVYLRGTQSASVTLKYDEDAMKAPGLYTADVEVREEGTPDEVAPEAILRTTVIIPDRFTEENSGRVAWEGEAGPSHRPDRHFLFVPAWAQSVRFALESPEPRDYPLAASLFMHDGRMVSTKLSLSEKSPKSKAEWTWSRDLEPGTIEIPVQERSGEKKGRYKLTATLGSIVSTPTALSATWREGKGAKARCTVVSMAAEPEKARASASFDALRMTDTAQFGGDGNGDSYVHTIRFGPETKRLRVRVEFDRDDYAQFTDVALSIDADGDRLASGAMSTREETIECDVSGHDEVSFRLVPAFSDTLRHPEITAHLTIDRILASPLSAKVKVGSTDSDSLSLFPGSPIDIEAAWKGDAPDAVSGTDLSGWLILVSPDDNETLLEVPISASHSDD